jgi:hypothetical protein
MPTGPLNPPATTKRPLSLLSGSPANGAGAGPKITFALFFGSYVEPWHEQTMAIFSVDQWITGQDWCVHMAE